MKSGGGDRSREAGRVFEVIGQMGARRGDEDRRVAGVRSAQTFYGNEIAAIS